MARAAAAGQQQPVFRYVFSQALEGPILRLAGAFHGVELGFVFGMLGSVQSAPVTADEQALGDAVIGYWSRFAASGDPNGAGAPDWPQYDSSDPYIDLHAPTPSAGAGYHADRCDFLASLAGVPAY